MKTQQEKRQIREDKLEARRLDARMKRERTKTDDKKIKIVKQHIMQAFTLLQEIESGR